MANKKSTPAPCMADIPVPHRLVKLFWQLAPAFTRWAESHMTQKDLTPQRVRLMVPLLENGPMMMSALRNELGVSATSITALVDTLEKDGMVKRRAHKTDRRTTMVEITAKAEKKLTDNCSHFKDQVSEIFSGLSAAEQKQLLALLEKMRGALVQEKILSDSK
jgi:DNA-binding MarR family transcriptional regulator